MCRGLCARRARARARLVRVGANPRVSRQEPREVVQRAFFGAQALQAVGPQLKKRWVSVKSSRSPNEVEFLFSLLAFCEARALPICAWTCVITAGLHVESCSKYRASQNSNVNRLRVCSAILCGAMSLFYHWDR